MYCGVPIAVPLRVSALPSFSPESSFEIPKSRIFTCAVPSSRLVKNRFAGFRSRWTTPEACAFASAGAEQAFDEVFAGDRAADERVTHRTQKGSSLPRDLQDLVRRRHVGVPRRGRIEGEGRRVGGRAGEGGEERRRAAAAIRVALEQ